MPDPVTVIVAVRGFVAKLAVADRVIVAKFIPEALLAVNHASELVIVHPMLAVMLNVAVVLIAATFKLAVDTVKLGVAVVA